MFKILTFRLIFWILLFPKLVLSEKFIPCPLSWEEVYVGGGSSFPSSAVSTQLDNSSTNFIARLKLAGSYTIFALDYNQDDTFLGREDEENLEMEILTNPLNCTLKLVSVEKKTVPRKHLISTGKDNTFIGVIKTKNSTSYELTPCNMAFGAVQLCRPVQGTNNSSRALLKSLADWSNIFALKSYTKLQFYMEINDEKILNETIENYATKYMECDKLSNKGEADISKTFTHSTETAKKWTLALGAGIALDVDNAQVEVEVALFIIVKVISGSLSLHLGLHLGLNIGGDYSQEEKIIMTTSQRVNLPPKTTVEICSTIEERTTKVWFEGRAKVTHPFLEIKQIIDSLEKDDRFAGPYLVEDDAVIVFSVKGHATIVEPMNTQVVIAPLNYIDLRSLA